MHTLTAGCLLLAAVACSAPTPRLIIREVVAAPAAPMPPDVVWPRWRGGPKGRARVAWAQAVARWQVERTPDGCLEAAPEDPDVIVFTHENSVAAWGRGRLRLGECGRATPVAIDRPWRAEILPARLGDVVQTAAAPGGPTAIEVYALAHGRVIAGGAAQLDWPAGAEGSVVVVAGPQAPAGPSFLYVNDIANDHDGDGLGAALEADLGTSDALVDSDGDGIADAAETLGYHVPPDPPQLLPAWGASPTHKDLFVEIDWEDDGGPSVGLVDGPTVIQPTADRFARLRADSIRNPDGQPGVALHVDSGAPGGGTTWGDWGGFSVVPRTPDDSPDSAQAWAYVHAFASSRRGVFHHVFTHSRWAGAWGVQPGDQVLTNRLSQSAFQEELGHNVNLGHAGAGRAINCKPNYPSHMNYAWNGDFSEGRLTVLLNPLHLDEQLGLGTTDPARLAQLAGPPFFYRVQQGGAVDWNRDGKIDRNVRAWINYPVVFGYSCEAARYRVDGWGGTFGVIDPVRPAVARDGDRLVVLFGAGGHLAWRAMTAWQGCDPDIVLGCGNWSPPADTGIGIGEAPAAAELGGRLHVVVAGSDGRLGHFTMAAGAPQPLPGDLGAGPAATGDPGLCESGGALVLLYPAAGGALIERRWDGAWSPPRPVAPGVVVTRGTGVALAEGVIGAETVATVRAAVVTGGFVTLLRRDGAGEWTVEPDAFATARPETDRSPGLTYAPGPRQFMLMFRGVGATHVMRVDLTDASGRFAFPALQDNIWSASTVGPGLYYDARGDNVRMARTDGFGRLHIWPYADGLYDVDMHDVDDAQLVASGLCYALHGCGDPSCPPPPDLANGCGGQAQIVDEPTGAPPEDIP
jgi:hypothetical protein